MSSNDLTLDSAPAMVLRHARVASCARHLQRRSSLVKSVGGATCTLFTVALWPLLALQASAFILDITSVSESQRLVNFDMQDPQHSNTSGMILFPQWIDAYLGDSPLLLARRACEKLKWPRGKLCMNNMAKRCVPSLLSYYINLQSSFSFEDSPSRWCNDELLFQHLRTKHFGHLNAEFTELLYKAVGDCGTTGQCRVTHVGRSAAINSLLLGLDIARLRSWGADEADEVQVRCMEHVKSWEVVGGTPSLRELVRDDTDLLIISNLDVVRDLVELHSEGNRPMGGR